jgi:hypothetical protein
VVVPLWSSWCRWRANRALLALSLGGFYSTGCVSLLLEGSTLPGSYLEDGILIAKATHRVNRGEQMAGVIWRLIDLGRKSDLRRSLVALKAPARVWTRRQSDRKG